MDEVTSEGNRMFSREPTIVFLLSGVVLLTEVPYQAKAQDAQISPKTFGLGDNSNERTAEPSEVRLSNKGRWQNAG